MNRLQKELAAELTMDDIPDNHRPMAELIGLDKFILLCDYIKGDHLYLPQVDRVLAPVRNRNIRSECNGYNKRELARKYNLTIQQINNIMKNA